jgi:Flp pilus assembly CpaE family ATPase
VAHEADLVLINPLVEGYHHGLINDLLLNEKQPIPVAGMVPERSDLGREMLNNGAAFKIPLPINQSAIAAFLGNAEHAVNQAWQDRAQGRVQYHASATAGMDDLSYERNSIAIWVPKGGGSTRTTIATNLAVALSHVSLGGKETVLVDLDMSKGDCHTLLGYTTDPKEAAKYEMPLLERHLHSLVVRVVNAYGRKGQAALNALELNRVLTHWRPNESRLTLLPGLTSPAQAVAQEFRNMSLLYNVARELLSTLRGRGAFVVTDLGQDFTRPFHRAALDAADQVLVPVPPIRTAILDTKNALPVLKHQMGGNLNKFSLVLTAFDSAFGIHKKDIVRALEPLTPIATLPFDAQTANMALNTANPIVLLDREGSLGQALINLAGTFYPGLGQKQTVSPRGVKGTLHRIMFKGA